MSERGTFEGPCGLGDDSSIVDVKTVFLIVMVLLEKTLVHCGRATSLFSRRIEYKSVVFFHSEYREYYGHCRSEITLQIGVKLHMKKRIFVRYRISVNIQHAGVAVVSKTYLISFFKLGYDLMVEKTSLTIGNAFKNLKHASLTVGC